MRLRHGFYRHLDFWKMLFCISTHLFILGAVVHWGMIGFPDLPTNPWWVAVLCLVGVVGMSWVVFLLVGLVSVLLRDYLFERS